MIDVEHLDLVWYKFFLVEIKRVWSIFSFTSDQWSPKKKEDEDDFPLKAIVEGVWRLLDDDELRLHVRKKLLSVEIHGRDWTRSTTAPTTTTRHHSTRWVSSRTLR